MGIEMEQETTGLLYLVQRQEMTVELATALVDPELVLEKIKNLVVTDQATYEAAAAERIAINKQVASLEELRKKNVAPINAAFDDVQSKFINKAKTGAIDYRKAGIALIDQKLLDYENYLKAEAAKEQERLAEIARKADEKRRAELAEQEARQREKERQAREAEAAAIAAGNAEAAAKAAAAAAKAAEEAAKRQEAAAQVYTPPPVVVPQFTRAAGTAVRDNWTATVTDLMALVKAVASGQVEIAFLQADMTALNRQAKASKNTRMIPGVEFKNVPGMSSSRK